MAKESLMRGKEQLKQLAKLENNQFSNLTYDDQILVSNSTGTTQLYFWIDPVTRNIYYDVDLSEFNGESDSYDCQKHNFSNHGDELLEACLVKIGVWDIPEIPRPNEYDMNSPIGKILFKIYSDYDTRQILGINESASEYEDYYDDDFTQEELENIDFIDDDINDDLKLYASDVISVYTEKPFSSLRNNLDFYIDRKTRNVYLEVYKGAKYMGMSVKEYDCTPYNMANEGKSYICILKVGKWDIDEIPRPGQYTDKSTIGKIFLGIYGEYISNKKKTHLSDVEMLEGEGVVEELRGIRDAIIQTGNRCYQYTGSPMITMAEQSGSAPVQIPQSSMNAPPPPPPGSLPPPPPPGSQKREKVLTEEQQYNLTYGQEGNLADLTQLSLTDAGLQAIDTMQNKFPQLYNKLRLATYKAYKDNAEAKDNFIRTGNVGWAKSSTQDIISAANAVPKPTASYGISDILAARKRILKTDDAKPEGSGMYRQRYHHRRV